MNKPNPDMRLKAEAHLRSILATVPDAMVVIDEQGSILSFSAAAEAMFGYGEAEVVGRNVKMLMPSPDRERHDQYLGNYSQPGSARLLESVGLPLRYTTMGAPFRLSCQSARLGSGIGASLPALSAT